MWNNNSSNNNNQHCQPTTNNPQQTTTTNKQQQPTNNTNNKTKITNIIMTGGQTDKPWKGSVVGHLKATCASRVWRTRSAVAKLSKSLSHASSLMRFVPKAEEVAVPK
eukprot:5224884-Amphidinium_carterae.1